MLKRGRKNNAEKKNEKEKRQKEIIEVIKGVACHSIRRSIAHRMRQKNEKNRVNIEGVAMVQSES
jgi:hypothetical protein